MAKAAKRSFGLKMIADALLALDFAAVMATALIEEAPHEYLGIALAVLAIAHIVLNRRWFAALAKGRWTAVRVLQALSILGLIVCLVGQIVSAVVLSKHALWFLPAVPGASWARSVHMLCSYWMFVFAFAHVGLQFRGVLVRMGVLRKMGSATLWVARVVWVLVAAVGVWSFMQLGLLDYLLARVQFAAADHSASIFARCGQYASVAVLIAGVFHYVRALLARA